MREYKELKELDVMLSLLRGADIRVDNLIIKPYKLKEVQEYGYTRYMQNLQWMFMSVDDFISSVEDESKLNILRKKKDNLKAFDFYCKLGGADILALLMMSLQIVFRTEDVILLDNSVIALNFEKKGIAYRDEKGSIKIDSEILEMYREDELEIVHRDNFDDIVKVVKLQNYIMKAKEDVKSNPADDKARQLIEQMEANRKKVQAKKNITKNNSQENNIDISDIISAVSTKSNSINKLNVWELTIYQLYDEYSRLELIDSYDFSIKAMMAGAEKVELKHWSSKIE